MAPCTFDHLEKDRQVFNQVTTCGTTNYACNNKLQRVTTYEPPLIKS